MLYAGQRLLQRRKLLTPVLERLEIKRILGRMGLSLLSRIGSSHGNPLAEGLDLNLRKLRLRGHGLVVRVVLNALQEATGLGISGHNHLS